MVYQASRQHLLSMGVWGKGVFDKHAMRNGLVTGIKNPTVQPKFLLRFESVSSTTISTLMDIFVLNYKGWGECS